MPFEDVSPREPASLEELRAFISVLVYFGDPQVSGAAKRLGSAAAEIRDRFEAQCAEREGAFELKEAELNRKETSLFAWEAELRGLAQATEAKRLELDQALHTMAAAFSPDAA